MVVSTWLFWLGIAVMYLEANGMILVPLVAFCPYTQLNEATRIQSMATTQPLSPCHSAHGLVCTWLIWVSKPFRIEFRHDRLVQRRLESS